MFIYKRPLAAVIAALLTALTFVTANLLFMVGG